MVSVLLGPLPPGVPTEKGLGERVIRDNRLAEQAIGTDSAFRASQVPLALLTRVLDTETDRVMEKAKSFRSMIESATLTLVPRRYWGGGEEAERARREFRAGPVALERELHMLEHRNPRDHLDEQMTVVVAEI